MFEVVFPFLKPGLGMPDVSCGLFPLELPGLGIRLGYMSPFPMPLELELLIAALF